MANSAKALNQKGGMLVQAVMERDSHIRRLSSTTEKLAHNARDKEIQNRKLSDLNDRLTCNLDEANSANRKLSKINDCLNKNVRDLQERLAAEKCLNQKLQCQMEKCKSDAKMCREEIEDMKKTIREQLLRAPKGVRDQAYLEQKLVDYRERERRCLEQIEQLSQQIQVLLEGKNDPEMERLQNENKRLVAKIDELKKTC